ncbi:MAG: hypothetical protein V3U60_11190 [Gammaproteobacteria bacterium]
MPTKTGTIAQVEAAAESGTDSITVPADCELIEAHSFQYNGGGGNTLSTLTLDGDPFTIPVNTAESGGIQGQVVAHLSNPSTSTQTLAWDWVDSDSMDEGGEIGLIFWKEVDLAGPVRDSDSDGATSDNLPGPLSLTTIATDAVAGMGMCSDSNPGDNPDLGISGQTVLVNNWGYTIHVIDIAEVDSPGASSTSFGMLDNANNLEYSAISAIAIIHVPAAGAIMNQMQGSNLGSDLYNGTLQ